jgi:hypothetical protein
LVWDIISDLEAVEKGYAAAVYMAEERLAKNEEAAQKLAASESLNVYFRDAIGECHLMISRKTSEYQVRKEWECTDLPHRLQTVMKRIEELELALSAETSGLLKRAERAEADIEKLKMDAEHLQYERDEARKNLAAMEADVDSLGDLPSSWPTNEAESASPPPADAVASEDLVAKVRDALADLFTEGLNLREGVTLSFTTYARRICALFEGAGGGLLASTVLAWLKERGGESWKATIRDMEYAIENLQSSPLAVASSTETPLSDAAKGYLGRMADEKALRASAPGLYHDPVMVSELGNLSNAIHLAWPTKYLVEWVERLKNRASALARDYAAQKGDIAGDHTGMHWDGLAGTWREDSTSPQKPLCPHYCEPSHVVGEKCACPCHEQKPQGDAQNYCDCGRHVDENGDQIHYAPCPYAK